MRVVCCFLLGILIQVSFIGFARAGFTFISGDDSDDSGHCETASSCNFLIVNIMQYAIDTSTVSTSTKDILAIGVHSGRAETSLSNWATYGGWSYDIVLNNDITNVNLEDYKMIYFPSDESNTPGGILCTEVTLLSDRTEDIARFVNSLGGSLMALTQQSCSGAYSWLPITITPQSTSLQVLDLTDNLLAIVDTLDSDSLDHCCYHAKFTGPEGYGGLNVLATDPNDGDVPIILGGLNIILTSEICNDGTDNDGDTLIDLADPDCLETNCIDGVDNNFDGLSDCNDANCQAIWPDCFLVTEICDDEIDNDGDGLIDLLDPDCLELECDDGIDNNADGLVDCDDSNCIANWPACIFEASFATIVPQTICQGLAYLDGTDVKCSQKRGFEVFDFFSLSHFRPENETEFVNAYSYSGATHLEDTMVNCEVEYDEDFSQLQFLEVVGFQAGVESYQMLQKFTFSSEEVDAIKSTYVRAVFLFQKGSGFGQGSSSVFPARSDWFAANASCPDRYMSYLDNNCTAISNEAIATPVYGWAVINITDVFNCQFYAYEQLNLVWQQDSTAREGQAWHSAESHNFSPFLVVYYGTEEPTSQPSTSFNPTVIPSVVPSSQPSISSNPTSIPSASPITSAPTSEPSSTPSDQPTGEPTGQPSGEPSSSPTL